MATKTEKETPPIMKGVVLYVDGGCRPGYPTQPNTAFGGWGIHGYEYDLATIGSKPKGKKDVSTVVGYLSQPDPDLHVSPINYIDGYGSLTSEETNNTAELNGFKQALKLIEEKGYQRAQLLLDSQYVIKGATEYYPRWKANNWRKPDGGTYSNRPLWESIMDTYNQLNPTINMSIDWVNGHSGNLGNDRADYLATKGVFKGRNGVVNHTSMTYTSPTKYRNPNPYIHPFLSRSKWYFTAHQETPLRAADGRYIYHCGHHGKDDTLVGKKIADNVVSVLYLKEELSVFEMIRQTHRKLIPNPLHELSYGALDTILLPGIYDELKKDGADILSIAPRRLGFTGLTTIDDRLVTKVIRPSGLTFYLLDVFNFIHRQIDAYQHANLMVTDVTEMFYETKTDKKGNKAFNLKIPQTIKSLKLNVKIDNEMYQEYPCHLTVGIDIPPYLMLKRIQTLRPTVLMVTWRLSENAFAYGVIFESKEDLLFWMAKDSNIQLVYPPNKEKG